MPIQDDSNEQADGPCDPSTFQQQPKPRTEDNDDTSRNKDDRASRPHWADIIIAVFTGLILITYITSDYFLWRQLRITSGQLDQMKGSSTQADRLIVETHDLSVATKNQADATRAIAESSKAQAAVAVSNSNITAKQLELSQRSWISADLSIVGPMTLQGTILSLGVGMTLKNTGHSPAINIISRTELVAHSPDVHGFHISEDLKRCAILKESAEFAKFTVFPGDALKITPNMIIATDVRPVAKVGTDVFVAVVNCFDYQMPFLTEHHQTAYVSMVGHVSEQATGGQGVSLDAQGMLHLSPAWPGVPTLIKIAVAAN